MSVGILVDVGKSLTSVVGASVSVDLDVLKSEAHEWTADATSNPVEIGSNVTDHILLLPDRITISGMISDAPLSPQAAARFSGGIDGAVTTTRVQTAFDFLRALHEKRLPVTIYTKHKIYADMAMVGCSIPRNRETGAAVEFTLQFSHIRMVSTQTTTVPPGITAKPQKLAGGAKGPIAKKAQPQKDVGKVQNKKITNVEEQKSAAAGMFGLTNPMAPSVASVGF